MRDCFPTTVACETAVHPSSPSKAKDDGIAQEFGAVSTAQCEARGKQNPILMHGAERRCRLEHATVRVARGGKPCRFRPHTPVFPPPQPSLATCSRGAPKHDGVCAVRRASVSQAYGLVGTHVSDSREHRLYEQEASRAPSRELKRVSAPESYSVSGWASELRRRTGGFCSYPATTTFREQTS